METVSDYDLLHHLRAELVCNESLRNYRKEQLRREIDCALDVRDKRAFKALTCELRYLLKFK